MQSELNDTFLKACRCEPTPYVPVWFMRQAGRYQPEYRKIREKYSLFEITHRPEICAEVTRLPVEQLGVDAAILFADIMTPLVASGVNVKMKEGVGPVIDDPIRRLEDVEALGCLTPEKDVPYTLETIRLLKKSLSVPLIGFAGAPFTLASYLIEGGPAKDYHYTKAFMHRDAEVWQFLMEKLASLTGRYLEAQIRAGVDAVQIFDSWVGTLSADHYRQSVAPVMQRLFRKLRSFQVPIIYFGVGARHLLPEWRRLDVDVIGLDWRTPIIEARRLGVKQAVQGNMDPSLLLAQWEKIEEEARRILDEGMQQPGFIFNLGHGVFPDVEAQTLRRLTRFVHEYSARGVQV